MEDKYVIYYGLHGPCSQLRGLHCIDKYIHTLNRKFIEPILFSHNHSKTSDFCHYKFTEVFKNRNMIDIDTINDISKASITWFVFIRSDDTSVEYAKKVLKINREQYIDHFKQYYGFDPNDTRISFIVNANIKEVNKCSSDIVILSTYNALMNKGFHEEKTFEFNDFITSKADEYIKRKFSNKKFLAINIRRLKDNESEYKSWKDFYGFTFNRLADSLIKYTNCMENKKFFLSIKPTVLNIYDDIDHDKFYSYSGDDDIKENIAQYIEQCICSKAKMYIFTGGSVYSELPCAFVDKSTRVKNIYYLMDNNGRLCKRSSGIR